MSQPNENESARPQPDPAAIIARNTTILVRFLVWLPLTVIGFFLVVTVFSAAGSASPFGGVVLLMILAGGVYVWARWDTKRPRRPAAPPTETSPMAQRFHDRFEE